MKLGLTIEKLWNRFYVRYIVPHLEKTYRAEDGEELHYLLYRKPESRVLVVVLQAFHPDGHRYNYLATLTGIKANRLYIKDDFAPYTGNFYLGREGRFNQEADVHTLIQKIAEQCQAEKLIFVGSSKGGSAAVNFGIEYPGSSMIVAAPMYHTGSWMWDTKKFNPALTDVLGGSITAEKIAMLDRRLPDKVKADPYAKSQKLFIHCSLKDKTYENHVIDMLADMKEAGVSIVFDQGDYEGHENLKWYFPDFLKETIKKEIEQA